ncbi:hypothetical protein ABZ656_11780 [Streptomyces sp. NPDC007095]|uniref:hypothetical protein n=1 Tax=Streptomyces sp. NPDC007095 TaxID=3154482 RepID=UPI00340A1941
MDMHAGKDADDLRTAINQGLDCADVTAPTRRVLIHGSSHDPALLTTQVEAKLFACRRSHDLCAQHAQHRKHRRICAETTDHAAGACRGEFNATVLKPGLTDHREDAG